jgi:murein DD-endopeptidase MepM/ murein hydrolase activator NlpD
MTVVHRRIAAALVLISLVVVLAPGSVRVPVSADEPNVEDAISQQEQMEAELARQRGELAALRREEAALTASLADLRGDLDAVGLELKQAIRKLDAVTERLDASRADLARYQRQIAALEDNLDQVAADIVQAQVELAEREELLQDHLRDAYEQSQTSVLEILLSSETFGEATSQLSYMLTMSEEDRQLAEEIRRTREQLEIRQQTLRDGRVTLRELRDAEAERAASLAEQQAQVDAARRELRAYQRQLQRLRATQRAHLHAAQLNKKQTRALLRKQRQALADQRRLVERLKRRANRLDLAYRGRFAWPEKGEVIVTQEFGKTKFNPKHTGIDMAYHTPTCGGPIYAAGDGVVLADGRPLEAYDDDAIGVIIGHSQRLQTWYWHLSKEVVKVGEKVKTGDLLGYEGQTGIATGCHLHFEVWFDDDPVNPRGYLP